MLSSLISSADRFKEELIPLGYERRSINWVIIINPKTKKISLEGPYKKEELVKIVPVRADRSGTPSPDNLKPSFIVDNATYALGISNPGKEFEANFVHKGFIDTLNTIVKENDYDELSCILDFLKRDDFWAQINAVLELKHVGKKNAVIRPNDIVAFAVKPDDADGDSKLFLFERRDIQKIWMNYIKRNYESGDGFCAICGQYAPIVRILPFTVSIMGYSCPITAFNSPSFTSFGKEQTNNATLCFECIGTANQVLQYLIYNEQHHVSIMIDKTKGKAKAPLKNQLAVFWLKEPVQLNLKNEKILFNLDELVSSPLRYDEINPGPPPELVQLKRLLNLPWSSSNQALKIKHNSFHLAVLSPNKSRLVLREWIKEDLHAVLEHLTNYIRGLEIIDPNGNEIWSPSIPAILNSLKNDESNVTIDSNLERSLLKTVYTGHSPPFELIKMAVQQFRIPDKPTDSKVEKYKQSLRRMALVSAIKLFLTFRNKEEAKNMEQLDENRHTIPYLCGQLLAVLEEIQLRHANWKLNATIVDRFYGSVSTSPASFFGTLISRATTDHIPKLRKEGGYLAIEQTLERILGLITEFPNMLNVVQQGEFALGFYHQRAFYNKERNSK